jgi:hypothetical protein
MAEQARSKGKPASTYVTVIAKDHKRQANRQLRQRTKEALRRNRECPQRLRETFRGWPD